MNILAHVSRRVYEGISQGLSKEWNGWFVSGPGVKLLVSVSVHIDSRQVSGADTALITDVQYDSGSPVPSPCPGLEQ